ncbi:MAG: hypothetical protein PVH87_16075 [Desulfobacteraceae bacterium]|jgi:hypothetical protein
MEILAEFALWLLGAAGEIFFELLAQAAFELLAEFGLRSLVEPLRRPKPIHPILATFGYAIYGAGAGALSLALLPDLFIKLRSLQIANLIITPVLCGVLMGVRGALRKKKEKDVIPLDSFLYGFVFAFAMAGVRYFWQ